MARDRIQLNATAVDDPGYWVDRHGHAVFRCAGQLLPACPQRPFGTTMWRLARSLPCNDDRSELADAA